MNNFFNVRLYNNQLSINVEPGFLNNSTVSAYYLHRIELNSELIVDRHNTDSLTHVFNLTKSASYAVIVYYKDSNGVNKKFRSEAISVDLISTPIDLLKNNTVIQISKNKIICDFTKNFNLVNRIIKYELLFNNNSIFNNSGELKCIFNISVTGKYKLRVFYEDYNSNIETLEYDVEGVHSELITTSIGKSSHTKIYIINFELIFSILWAFVIREFQKRYDKGYLRYFSLILEPLIQFGIIIFLFSIFNIKNILSLDAPVFVLTGLIPYNLFAKCQNNMSIISANRGILIYRHVKIIDIMLANVCMEFMLSCMIFLVGLLILSYSGINIRVYNPIAIIIAFIFLFFLTFSFSIILGVLGYYFAEVKYPVQIIFRGLFYISGVFFPISRIPHDYKEHLFMNPILQLIEIIRFAFIRTQIPEECSYLYLFEVTLITFSFGLMLYLVNRHKFLINDLARV